MTLRADAVSIGLDGEAILEDISLSVEEGEVVTIVGPSGTGKTTLLRLSTAFHLPNGGTIQ